jgi:glycosyltransferase involved in cell wall biosynthesis
MVRRALAGLPGRGIEVRHVNLSLSMQTGEIGRWNLLKPLRLLRILREAERELRRAPCDALYYVPAPGKALAARRDVFLLSRLRRICPRLVLHWHAVGLVDWMETPQGRALAPQLRRALGHADLSLVLGESLRHDAEVLESRRVHVVANGIEDPLPEGVPPGIIREGRPFRCFHLGLCSEEKGVFDLIEAHRRFRERRPGSELVLAGPAPDALTAERLHRLCAQSHGTLFWTGFVQGARLESLWAATDLFCFASRYPHEAQPLVLIEAMARGVPVAAVRWRGVPDMLPEGTPLAPVGDSEALASLMLSQAEASHGPGAGWREHFQEHFTVERHLDALSSALLSLFPSAGRSG